jgi:hypothetical protein
MLYEGFLQGMKVAVCGEALDSRDVTALILDRERETGIDALAIHQYGACAACALITPFLGAGKSQIVAHEIKQRSADVCLDLHCRSVDVKSHWTSPSSEGPRWRICRGTHGTHGNGLPVTSRRLVDATTFCSSCLLR